MEDTKATPTVPLVLHPEHFVDLQRSGLLPDTLRELGIYSARPSDIPKLVGFDPPAIHSALIFPYPGEDGFCRVKVFPSFKDKNDHAVKYLQKSGSGVHLYIPPLAAKVLSNPTIPLAWTEGEKKAAKACQEGLPCVGLGGLWNWLEDERPIVKLDEVAHVEREEVIFPDSDVWSWPDLLRAVYAFGKELEARGAKISAAIIPPGPQGEKRGLDDYLVACEQEGVKAQEALVNLKRVPLKHLAFSQAAGWWKEWIKRREMKAEPPPDVMKLLERVGQARKLHPAQDFVDGVLFYGVLA
ncbi:MAG: DUF3854 domain-containing protein, partial [candidate division NC10 bacterium]|nr:DUF3854 domain-containing protein [candidate division NC10 bacterium]